MKWSQSHLYTLKEAPNDAEIPSHKLMIRAGMMKKLDPGIFTYGTLALKAIRKFEGIVREELEKRGAQEVLMPALHPKELWQETNRWDEMGPGLMRLKNRNDKWFCLGATHEEAITDYVRNDLKSYKDLPRNLYQIQTKYRDEIRPRFGLMRGREFIMKDAYTFDMDKDGALKSYQTMYEAYQAIFDRLGAKYRIVEADAGNIGGSQTHEFQLLADAGEDSLLVSDASDFAANIEVCPAIDFEPHISNAKPLAKEKFATPNQKTIKDLATFTGQPEKELVKTLFYSSNSGLDPKDKALKPVAVLLRGSDDLNPTKLKKVLNLPNDPLMLTELEVKEVSGANPGSCGPVGLSIPVYMDNGVSGLKNYIVGANEDGFHFKNVNHGADFTPKAITDLRMARAGDKCPKSAGKLQSFRGIEVGHVFYLGRKYSEKMKAMFLDKNGKTQAFEMGCYGIGISRTVQAIIEQMHDADGIIWPLAIAPFQVHICLLDLKNEAVTKKANEIYEKLTAQGFDVLLDDRDERPGFKFKDADLLGMPFRVNVGAKTLEQGEVEVVERSTKQLTKIAEGQVISYLVEKISVRKNK